MDDWYQRMDGVYQALEAFLREQLRLGVSREDILRGVQLFLEDYEAWAKAALGDVEDSLTIPPLSNLPKEEQDQAMLDRLVDLILQATPLDQMEKWFEAVKEGREILIW